ncbi:MAG: metallopeptidase family protein [Elusimicrobiota bacterium]
MKIQEFENIIESAVKSLPDEFRQALEKNQIALIPREAVPAPLRRENRGSIVFGVFIGVPMGMFVNVHHEPTRIELYKESFEEAFSGRAEMETQIVKTVVHEIAHYFGFSEKKIRKLGY